MTCKNKKLIVKLHNAVLSLFISSKLDLWGTSDIIYMMPHIQKIMYHFRDFDCTIAHSKTPTFWEREPSLQNHFVNKCIRFK